MTIPTQTTGPRIPPDEARDGAAITVCRTGGGPGETSPVVAPGRSSQICNQCRRSGGQMTTIAMGAFRWRICHICTGRADKTTKLAAVVCAHPYSRARGGAWVCIDCFEEVPGPPECSPEKRCTCEKCADAGHAGLSLIVPVGLFGGLMLALAGVSGNLGYLWRHLPLTPTPNGFTALCVAALVGGCWWRLRNAVTTPHESLEELLHFDSQPEGEDPWYGTSPFTDVDPDQTLPTPAARRPGGMDMTTTTEAAICGTWGPRRGYVGEHEAGTCPQLCIECANHAHAELIERRITELHDDLAAEAGGSPWTPIAARTVEDARTDIARMIQRERDAATLGAVRPEVAAYRSEAAWRQIHPGLAAFYDLTNPGVKSAKSVKS